MNIQPYLGFATQLAYCAGQITLGYFNTGIRPDYKVRHEEIDRLVYELSPEGTIYMG
jgi:hypothetical protein